MKGGRHPWKTESQLGVPCLLGENVYDGGHRNTLGEYVIFHPLPGGGMHAIPREAIQLENPESPRLVTIRSRKDMTKQMLDWAATRVRELESEGLCGYIFKSNSPSCGIKGVKVHNEKGMPVKKGMGLFARAFMKHFPLLPTEDEDRLHNPKLRENFIESIFAIKLRNHV